MGRRIKCITAAATLLAVALLAGSAPASAKSGAAAEQGQVAQLTDIKLRKLHLVRPDLILYPIAYEVFC